MNTAELPGIKTLNFPSTTFAIVRQMVKWEDVQAFYDRHISLILTETSTRNINAGTPAGLVYDWDEKNRTADIAAAVPVPAGTKLDNSIIEIESIPDSKAIYADQLGDPGKTPELYAMLRKYITENKLKQVNPVIEQFLVDATNESDSTKWRTRVVFLVK